MADPLYFSDGYGIYEGDLIQVNGQVARVTNVDHGSKTLTLDKNLNWSSGAGVSYPFTGNAPDAGAAER